jgi:hypothetical protein
MSASKKSSSSSSSFLTISSLSKVLPSVVPLSSQLMKIFDHLHQGNGLDAEYLFYVSLSLSLFDYLSLTHFLAEDQSSSSTIFHVSSSTMANGQPIVLNWKSIFPDKPISMLRLARQSPLRFSRREVQRKIRLSPSLRVTSLALLLV